MIVKINVRGWDFSMQTSKYKQLESSNTNFSLLRGLDLRQLLYEIENFYLIYRDTLNLSQNVTFAPEIEFEGLNHKFPSLKSLGLDGYKMNIDGSLSRGENGEINTPILRDSEKTWNDLGIICDYLLREQSDTCHSASCHINVGAHILGENIENWDLFCKMWAIYEPISYRFGYGDKVNERLTIREYASSRAIYIYKRKYLFNRKHCLSDLVYFCNLIDNSAVNLSHAINDTSKFYSGNRVEFKYPNATNDKVVLQNNINFNTKLLLSCSGIKIDREYINSKFNSLDPEYLYTMYYGEIDLKKALELVDLVFDNDLDKYYFLRQYLKSFELIFPSKTGIAVKKVAKRFTKKI